MGEIKSTLDLVLARTRHLKLSSAERAEQQRREFSNALRGCLNRQAQGGMSLQEALQRFDRLRDQHQIDVATGRAILLGEFRLSDESRTEALADLLAARFPADRRPVRTLVDEYREAYRRSRQRWETIARRRLMEERAIAGTALVFRPELDPEWVREATELELRYGKRLSRIPRASS